MDTITAAECVEFLRDHRGMSLQHMDVLLAYVERLERAAEAVAFDADLSDDAPEVSMVSSELVAELTKSVQARTTPVNPWAPR